MGRAVDDDDVVVAGAALDLCRGAPAGDGGEVEPGPVLAEPFGAQGMPRGEAALRVDVDEGDAVSLTGPGDGEMRRERGLAGAALLLRDGDNGSSHARRPGMMLRCSNLGRATPRRQAATAAGGGVIQASFLPADETLPTIDLTAEPD